jgi:ketosteroid isomerase-like protein
VTADAVAELDVDIAGLHESGVDWRAPSRAVHPARAAGLASYRAVCAKDKQAWLGLFADDGWIEDPVGVSPIDPTGAGHHGAGARSRFWDNTIATVRTFVFEIHDSFAAGTECANTGVIHMTMENGFALDCEGVFIYRVNDTGQLLSLRAIWEFDRSMATARQTS